MHLITVKFTGVDGVKASADLPRDGLADATTVRSLNAAGKGGMINAEDAKEYRALADFCAHSALEAGRAHMTNLRNTLATMTPVDRANALKAALKLRVSRTF